MLMSFDTAKRRKARRGAGKLISVSSNLPEAQKDNEIKRNV